MRIRLLDLPLERDEGEYAYAGRLLLEGIPPYKLAYNMKLPGTYLAYAMVMGVLGKSVAGIHWGLILVTSTSTVLLFLLARKLFNANSVAPIISAATFGLLSLSPSVFGHAAHATHFVVLPVIAGCWLLLRSIERGGKGLMLFLAGMLFGVAFLMKQHGVFFGIFALIWLVWSQCSPARQVSSKILQRCGVFSLGAVLPFGLTCLWLWSAAVFPAFWHWTFDYAREYIGRNDWGKAVGLFLNNFTLAIRYDGWLWGLAGGGLVALLWRCRMVKHASFLGGLLVASFIAISPGFYFREHYFILLLPIVGLLVGLLIDTLQTLPSVPRLAPLFLFLAIWVGAVYGQRAYLFQKSPTLVCRQIHGANPFVEAPEVAKFIREHTTTQATIAVFGSEPEIYFYAQRHSATGFIYMYPLMEQQSYALEMQQQMMREIEAARPDYVVLLENPASWSAQPNSHSEIFVWIKQYVAEQLQLVGLVDMISTQRTDYHWNLEGGFPKLESPFVISIFRRKDLP